MNSPRLSTAVLTVLMSISFALISPLSADGHYSTLDDPRPEGVWFNYGVLYKGEDPVRSTMKDPVNLVFAGGSYEGNSNVHAGTVARALDDNWDSRYENRMRKERVCVSSLNLIWRHSAGRQKKKEGSPDRSAPKQDFQRLATHPNCDDQYHIRGYEDGVHYKHTNHGRRDQYLLAGIHHEKRKGAVGGHKPDRDWDKVRAEAVKAMRKHCSVYHFAYHPAAERTFQGYDNTGLIDRISLRLRSSGCGGA